MSKIHQLRVLADAIWTHPSNGGRRVRAIAAALGWQLYKRLVGKPLTLTLPSGMRIRCYPDSHEAGSVIYFNGSPDPTECIFLERYLRKGDKVIDAGANVGLYTLFLAHLVGPDGEVVAFEPGSKAVARLRENLLVNALSNVRVVEAAVADYEGTAQFNQDEDAANTFAALRTSKASSEVQVVRLDDDLTHGQFAVCKLDVEGAEPGALRGAERGLSNGNPAVWLIELTNRTLRRDGSTVDQVTDWLAARGYELWEFDPVTNSLLPWIMKDRKPGHVGDAIAIARASLERVRARLEEGQGG